MRYKNASGTAFEPLFDRRKTDIESIELITRLCGVESRGNKGNQSQKQTIKNSNNIVWSISELSLGLNGEDSHLL